VAPAALAKARRRLTAQHAPLPAPRYSDAELRRQRTIQRTLEGVNAMRNDKLSLARAAKMAGTTPRTMLRHGASALTLKNGRYVAKKFDRIPRIMRHMTVRGVVDVTVRSSRIASRIASHAAAVKRFLLSGDVAVLWPFEGKTFRVGRHVYVFLTDPTVLERLANAGEVTYEDLYVLTPGDV
jgi:hypothetical protein